MCKKCKPRILGWHLDFKNEVSSAQGRVRKVYIGENVY